MVWQISYVNAEYYSTFLTMSQNSETVFACTYVAQRVYILYTSKKECHESGGTLFLSIWTAADKQVSSSVCLLLSLDDGICKD